MTRESLLVPRKFLEIIKTDPTEYLLDPKMPVASEQLQRATGLIWHLADYYHNGKNPNISKTDPATSQLKVGFLFPFVRFDVPSIKLVEWGLVSTATALSIEKRHYRRIQAQQGEPESEILPPTNRITIRFQREKDPQVLTITETYIREDISGDEEESRIDNLVEEKIEIGKNGQQYTISSERRIKEQITHKRGESQDTPQEVLEGLSPEQAITPRSINTTIVFLTEAVKEVLPWSRPKIPITPTSGR